MFSSSLIPPPPDLDLPSNEIHVWYAFLDQTTHLLHTFEEMLSIDEKVRAHRFYFERDRKRFIARRGILRNILGRHLDVEPSSLQFCYGKNGKPALAKTYGKGDIRFNMSHSEGIAVYAFTRGREIGVDIERIHEIPEMDRIAERFFSTRENAVFCALPKSKRKEAFFDCWTRKEAFIKAIGDGLSRPLDKFDVSLVPDEPARLLRIEGDPKGPSRWSIQELKPASGLAAAFAVEGQSSRPHCWQWGE